jgi:hypothetical protein
MLSNLNCKVDVSPAEIWFSPPTWLSSVILPTIENDLKFNVSIATDCDKANYAVNHSHFNKDILVYFVLCTVVQYLFSIILRGGKRNPLCRELQMEATEYDGEIFFYPKAAACESPRLTLSDLQRIPGRFLQCALTVDRITFRS